MYILLIPIHFLQIPSPIPFQWSRLAQTLEYDPNSTATSDQWFARFRIDKHFYEYHSEVCLLHFLLSHIKHK